jgi:PAS domain S-box-containing protein
MKQRNAVMPLDTSLTNDILDSLGEGVFTVDKNFKINFFNQAAERMTGLRREEVVGKFCKKIFNSKLCLENCPIAQILESGRNIFDIESEIHHRNGHKLSIRLNAAVLRNQRNDTPVGGVISFRDLSDLEIIKEKLKHKKSFHDVIGSSKIMQEIFLLIEEIADSDASVLIQGESGTGKEMIANAIQATSLRKNAPFIKVNCSVFPPQLLASELFGHVRGAFTGAIRDRLGRFEMANKGTLFLDEVAEMPLQMQLQLLRVLQEGTFERVGESITRRVDVRIIAATNKDLKKAIADGKFREDLFYRLNVIPMEIPPLRERPEDIPHLVEHFIQKYSLLSKKNIQEVEDSAMDLLLKYTWPGNIRELENAIEYAAARTKGTIIKTAVLPPSIRPNNNHAANLNHPSAGELNQPEYQKLLHLLEKYHWNRTRVAQELGIGRTTLWRKIREYRLDHP